MRIITWNCNMAFRKKAERILEYDPDILVIPECENPDALKLSSFPKMPSAVIWHGDNAHKGLGVFAYNGYQLKLLPVHQPEFKTILPISVKGDGINFILFAVWANNPSDKPNQYVGQVWKAIHHYDELIRTKKTILAGDFNSNTIWDKPRRVGNHSGVVEKFGTKKIRSVYHHHFGQLQGKEEHATFHLYKHLDKPYHLDYCFASNDLIKKLKGVEIGSHEQWYMHSDHLPLIIDFDI
ncbi:MAG TPA: endonuclease/exonuclease/phosphatase family protein [Mucilaginibacter sp.]|nr:endonuclease/exonuclease/phosphatase family protein [Mucilaginibacter sp.]